MTLDALGHAGQECTLYTEMQVREDLMALYGFATQKELDWFRVLTSVQGVGMKVGLAILSVATPAQLHSAVLLQASATFTAADGVGPKLGTRLVHELKDKVAKQFGAQIPLSLVKGRSTPPDFTPPDGAFQDAASALINLGYKPFDVNQAVAFLRQEGHTGTVEAIIPLALNRLSKKA
jgi:Holliday junction DNA helicase RuvA